MFCIFLLDLSRISVCQIFGSQPLLGTRSHLSQRPSTRLSWPRSPRPRPPRPPPGAGCYRWSRPGSAPDTGSNLATDQTGPLPHPQWSSRYQSEDSLCNEFHPISIKNIRFVSPDKIWVFLRPIVYLKLRLCLKQKAFPGPVEGFWDDDGRGDEGSEDVVLSVHNTHQGWTVCNGWANPSDFQYISTFTMTRIGHFITCTCWRGCSHGRLWSRSGASHKLSLWLVTS